MAWSTSASAVSFLAERTDLPLLRGVADGVERHPVLPDLPRPELLHQRLRRGTGGGQINAAELIGRLRLT